MIPPATGDLQTSLKRILGKVIPIVVPTKFTLGDEVGNLCLVGEKSRLPRRAHKTSRRRPSPRWSRAIHVKATMPDNQGSWHYDIWWRDLVGDTIRMIPDRSMPSSSWQQYRTSNPEISLYTTPLIACKRKEYISDRGGNQI